MSAPGDPTERFTDRVDAYIRYRPSYGGELLDLLASECALPAQAVVADIGSGTGLLSRLFLEGGHRVFGVEPNRAMRQAGERLLAGYPAFTSVDGNAEASTLDAASVHLVAAAQAFHWFDPAAAHAEFRRILKPGGWVALIWNERRKESTPFLRAYERLLLDHGTDYAAVDHTRIGKAELAAFFGPAGFRSASFEHRQLFDFEGLRGRLLSSSYAPTETDPCTPAVLAELRRIFDTHQSGGLVSLDYDTRLHYGRLEA